MKTPRRQNLIEYGFVAAMLLLCGTLTALQYRWTGELAGAEAERLRSSLQEQARRLTWSFDADLATETTLLVPTEEELSTLGVPGAAEARYRNWLARRSRPLFKRLAVSAVPENPNPPFLMLEEATGRFIPADWPEDWEGLRENLRHPPERRRWDAADDAWHTFVIDVPLLSLDSGPEWAMDEVDEGLMDLLGIEEERRPPPGRGPRRGRGPGGREDMKWMLLELDREYLTQTWLPELVLRYLGDFPSSGYHVQVRTAGPNSSIIFESAGSKAGMSKLDASVPFNRRGTMLRDHRAQLEPQWEMLVLHRPGVLDGIVGKTRRRNLILAVLLNALILTASGFLLHSTRRSRKLAEDQMNFAASVSHELRTPLTVIRGAAHNMRRGVVKDPGRVDAYLGMIIQHVDQLTAMVEQVLEYAGLQQKTGPIVSESVGVETLLREAVAATAADTEAAACQVEVALDDALPDLKGDSAALRRVFQNLIANAAKHAGDGGWIGVTAKTNGDAAGIEVQVADRGPGIPEGELAEIFKPFIRGSGALAAQTRGSGLGLSLVRQIVEAHGGSVSAQSKPGQGATFIVRLPRLP